jgi:hypothetical protein
MRPKIIFFRKLHMLKERKYKHSLIITLPVPVLNGIIGDAMKSKIKTNGFKLNVN